MSFSIDKRKSAIENQTLSLPLFMFGVDANYPDHSLAVYDFALVAHFFYRSSDFHFSLLTYIDTLCAPDSNRKVTIQPGLDRQEEF